MSSKVIITPVAFDSFGVKGMCTRIETPDLSVTIDPGVSLQTEAFPLPEQHRQELLARHQTAVFDSCGRSPLIVITHYHLDHFIFAREPRLYSGKILFLKSLQDLPQKQLETAERFLKTIDGLPKEIIWADGRKFKFKKTTIGFSAPIWHGQAEAEPGKVIMVSVQRGKEIVLVTSDVAGPTDPTAVNTICNINPVAAVIDGYPSFLQNYPQTDNQLLKSIINLCQILALPRLKKLILDHHLARDYRYPALFRLVYQKAHELKKHFGTAAEIIGKKSAVLEGLQDYGTTRWHRWQPIELTDARQRLEKAVAEGALEENWLSAFDRWVAVDS